MNHPVQDELPLHHYPAVQGMHHTTLTADPWQAFFRACWDEYEAMMQRRAARQSAPSEPEPCVQLNSTSVHPDRSSEPAPCPHGPR